MSMYEHTPTTVTVIEVARSMGPDLPKKTAWRVGSRVAHIYRCQYKRSPPAESRPKTSGSGSHYFAIYPASFIPVIKNVIETIGIEEERQTSLF